MKAGPNSRKRGIFVAFSGQSEASERRQLAQRGGIACRNVRVIRIGTDVVGESP